MMIRKFIIVNLTRIQISHYSCSLANFRCDETGWDRNDFQLNFFGSLFSVRARGNAIPLFDTTDISENIFIFQMKSNDFIALVNKMNRSGILDNLCRSDNFWNEISALSVLLELSLKIWNRCYIFFEHLVRHRSVIHVWNDSAF